MGLNVTGNSEDSAQTTPLKGGVLAGTALCSIVLLVAFGGEKVNVGLYAQGGQGNKSRCIHTASLKHTAPLKSSWIQYWSLLN